MSQEFLLIRVMSAVFDIGEKNFCTKERENDKAMSLLSIFLRQVSTEVTVGTGFYLR